MKYKIILWIGDRFCGPMLCSNGDIFYAGNEIEAHSAGRGVKERMKSVGVDHYTIEEVLS